MNILAKSVAFGVAAAAATLGASGASAAVDMGKLTLKSNGKGGYSARFNTPETKSFDISYSVVVPLNGILKLGTGITAGSLTSASFNGKPLKASGGTKNDALDYGFIRKGTYTFTVSGTGGVSGRLSGTFSLLPAAVPEPATWGLLIGGVGVTGGALRRSRRRAANDLATA